MTSAPVTVTARSRHFGLRLPNRDEITGLSAKQVNALLDDFWKDQQRGDLDWKCALTYRGQVVKQCGDLMIELPNQVSWVLEQIARYGEAEVQLEEPNRDTPRGVDGVLEYLQSGGCGALQRSKQWRIGYVPQSGCPWPVSQIHLFHRTAIFVMDESDAQNFQMLPGYASLRDQLLSLPGFPLETGFLPHHYIVIDGPGGWRSMIHAWDLGLVGYKVERNRVTSPDSGPYAYLLLRVDAPGEIVTEAMAEVKTGR